MAYIQKQLKLVRERLECKIDSEIVRTLALYCRYLESDRDYVVGQALEVAFRKDRGFAKWLKEQPEDIRAEAR